MKAALAPKPCDDTLDMFIESKARPKHPLRIVSKDSPMPDIKLETWTYWQFSTALHLLAHHIPERVTIRQLLVFSMIVEEVSSGHNTTIAEIRKKVGKDKSGSDLLGQSIGRSYQIFCQPTKKEPNNLGWVEVEENEDDRRQKFLRLTPKGEAIALEVAKALKSKP
uniref:Putative DNA binding, helix-turn-helix domain containing protein n=1 Tax=viral metagenome TaxID=1070528 RepID=A0A6M3XP66_9ZZZZ